MDDSPAEGAPRRKKPGTRPHTRAKKAARAEAKRGRRLRTFNARLREVEQRLRLALESGRIGSWDLDLETRAYLEISDLWKAHFGRPDLTHVTQEAFFEFLHPDDRDRVRDTIQEAIADRRDYAAEYRCVWPDGSLHWISAHGRLIYDQSNRPRRMVGMTQDITERKAGEDARERARRDAEDRADRDPLTSLLNHRAFHRRLAEEGERAWREGTCRAVVMVDLDNFSFFNNVYGHVLGDAVLRQVAARLQTVCRPYDAVARFGGDEFSLLLNAMEPMAAAEVESRLRLALAGMTFQPEGQDVAVPITVSLGAAVFGDGADRLEVIKAADQRLRRAKAGGDAETPADQVRLSARRAAEGFSMLDALVTAVDNKDRYTRRHSEDVMAHSMTIAREIGLDESTQQTVAVAALLHDVGKIGVPDSILRKPGKLTDEEFEAVKQHPQMGAAIVATVPELKGILDAVQHHHERWDGGGYPMGLRGEQTPLIARLMAVADAFSAMTTDRPYRQGMTWEKALAILQADCGAQWDPICVRAFLRGLNAHRP